MSFVIATRGLCINNLINMWYQVPNAPRYEINADTHEVRHVLRKKILKQAQTGDGYRLVCLTQDSGKPKTFYIHRILAELFVPQLSENDIVVNHKNLDKTDNRIENLEWTTPSGNLRHYFESDQWHKKRDEERKIRDEERRAFMGMFSLIRVCFKTDREKTIETIKKLASELSSR